MKKTLLITTWIVIGWLLVASLSSSFASMWQMGFWQWYSKSNSGSLNANYSSYWVNIDRTVKNIANWVEITMTSKDAATQEHMKTMFTQNNSRIPQNSLIKIERIQILDWVKMIVTSTDTDTIKSIQERANSAQSGVFGNSWQGKKWMKNWFWGRQGKLNGGNGGCPMFQK